MKVSPSRSSLHRCRVIATLLALFTPLNTIAADHWMTVAEQVGVLRNELERTQQPWPKLANDGFTAAVQAKDDVALRRALTNEVFVIVQINPEGRVKIARGPAAAELVAGRQKLFLVKIENASGGQQLLKPLSNFVGVPRNPFTLTIPTFGKLTPELVGHTVEYRLLEVTCQVAGKHELNMAVEAGQGSQDLGFRAEVPVLFTVAKPPR